ncbi:MAG: DedA family protein [Chloroflexi bacterium]|nr:MAG: DedA family protein [Chloroflexota bacterium]
MTDLLLSSFSLFGIPGLDFLNPVELIRLLGTAAVFAIPLIIFAESGLLIGFFLPGDSLLFTAGFLVQTGVIPINIHLFVLMLFVAAVVGDNVGYYFGKKVGRKVFDKPDSRIFKQKYLLKAEEFYKEHGAKTIIIARFIPVVRTFAPIVAGTAHMHYRTFFTYNIIGGLLWTAGITYIGYILGEGLTRIGLDIDQVILPIVAIIILISILPPIIHVLRDKQQREAIFAASNRQLDVLLRRKK